MTQGEARARRAEALDDGSEPAPRDLDREEVTNRGLQFLDLIQEGTSA